jgi:xyloglucan-specific exo-beta-1,4-glucanase
MNRIIIIASILCLSLNLHAQVNWKNVSTLGMGYVDGVTINPINNAKYVRTDVGGVFKFDDTNQKWINIFDNLITINQRDISSVESFAIDKTTSGNNQVIYALSGNYGYKSYLLKSTNNGQSWTINQDWDENRKVYGNGAWRCSGEKLAIDPNNSNVVYCGTRFDGLFKTTNAATNWNKVTSFTPTGGNGGLPEKGGISFVVFDPSTTISINSQIVSKNIYVGLIDEGIYRSNDGGQTWCFLANGFNINLYNPVRAVFSNNKLIVATMQDGDGYNDGEVWQFVPNANDCSGTYTNKTPGVANNYNCPYFGKYMYNAVAVRPGFPNTVYVAIRGLMPRKIFYTENFDAASPNWKILTNEGNSGYQSCLNQYQASSFSFPASWVNTDGYDWTGDIAFDQSDNKKLWMTSGNGVLKIEDITANPAQISSQTVMKDLEILCVNSMVSPPLPNTTPLFSNVMDILAVKYQNLDNGSFAKLDPTFGLGASISMDYSFQNPNTMAFIGQDYNNPATINRFLKTNDGGTTWQPFWTIPNSCNDAPWGGNIAVSSTNPNNFVWIPTNTSTITGCSNPVKNFPRFTTNGGTTWTFCNNINFPAGSFDFSFNSTFSIGKLLESDKVNGSKFYFYAMEGTTFVTKLWRTTDGGANWTAMSTGVMPITGNGQLKANPFLEDDIWFAPFNNYILQNDTNPNSRKLWHSTNGGTTWTTLSSIQEVYAFGFGMKKAGTNVASLIVYGKIGSVESIFVSYDLGQTFTDLGTTNIPEGIIGNIEGDMKVPNRIYASTGCRGAWYGDVTTALSTNQIAINSEKLVIYPNPAKEYFLVSVPNYDDFQNIKLVIYDLQGRVVKSKILKNKLDIFETFGLNKGIYIAEIEIDSKKFATKLILE